MRQGKTLIVLTIELCPYWHTSIRMEIKEHISLSISVTVICAVSSLKFNSGKFCDSTAEDN